MPKPIIWIIVLIAGAGIAGGTYHYFSADTLRPVSVPQPDHAVTVVPPAARPAPEHGNFQKRFQPSMPTGK